MSLSRFLCVVLFFLFVPVIVEAGFSASFPLSFSGPDKSLDVYGLPESNYGRSCVNGTLSLTGLSPPENVPDRECWDGGFYSFYLMSEDEFQMYGQDKAGFRSRRRNDNIYLKPLEDTGGRDTFSLNYCDKPGSTHKLYFVLYACGAAKCGTTDAQKCVEKVESYEFVLIPYLPEKIVSLTPKQKMDWFNHCIGKTGCDVISLSELLMRNAQGELLGYSHYSCGDIGGEEVEAACPSDSGSTCCPPNEVNCNGFRSNLRICKSYMEPEGVSCDNLQLTLDNFCKEGVGQAYETCDNKIDDDNDTLIDCQDDDCMAHKACLAELTGTITDGHNHTLPYLEVALLFNGKEYKTTSDENGTYSFQDLEGMMPDSLNPPEASVTAKLSYLRDGKEYFTVLDPAGALVTLEKKFKVKEKKDLKQDIDFRIKAPKNEDKSAKIGETEYATGGGFYLMGLHHPAATYFYTHQAVNFSLHVLKADLEHELPVEIYTCLGNSTYYSPSTSYIVIAEGDCIYGSTDRPKNREYHEFAHHVMYAEYGAWPEGRELPDTVNHDGYINPSTADSYIEGFAEFMAMAMAEYYNDSELKPPEQYAAIANLENNYKSWDWQGKAEEFAVAGILWDLHDRKNDKGDAVSLTLKQMWPILKVKRKDFYEYYKAFRQAFPSNASEIDGIFIEHGFFADTNKGNNKWDVVEAVRDTNENGAYDPGEPYVDYGLVGNYTKIVYDKGEVIGKAATYARANRSTAGYLPNAFIKVPDSEVHYYIVSVHYNNPKHGTDYEYTTEARQGLLYLTPLPEDVDALIMVKPKTQDYTAGSIYQISTQEYKEKYYAAPLGQGYMDEHNFNLQPTGSKKDPEYETIDGKESAWQMDGGYNVQEEMPAEDKTTFFCLPLLSLALAMTAALVKSSCNLILQNSLP